MQNVFVFKGISIHIWVYYLPPKNAETLDKSNSNASSKFHKDFITLLMNQGLHDAFRSFNTHAKQYSYTKNTSQHNNTTSEPSITKSYLDSIQLHPIH
ncbi:hypothetical protein RhiirA4_463455 [Rhizophagus irregularis]|uniref:Uncharacterized protein n=1 Tax=Rhizophagus irregularis TaxID=588596 RepID=A0A2I1GMZ3_9GLOM|nr:hypothetical protein RhiirA4_463455 [Rhizophagus irregularis]